MLVARRVAIGALAKWGTSGKFKIDFSFSVLDAAGGSPVTFPPDGEADDVPVPVPAAGYIEGDHAYDACPDGDDCHLIVVDRPGKKVAYAFPKTFTAQKEKIPSGSR